MRAWKTLEIGSLLGYIRKGQPLANIAKLLGRTEAEIQFAISRYLPKNTVIREKLVISGKDYDSIIARAQVILRLRIDQVAELSGGIR